MLRDDPLIAMALLHSTGTGLVANVSAPALTVLAQAETPPPPPGTDFVPADAAVFFARVEGRKMVMRLSTGESVELRFTSFTEMENNPFAFDNGDVNAHFSSGRQISGDWEYTKRRTTLQAALELDFFAGPGQGFYLRCDIDLLFDRDISGRLSASCPRAESEFPGGSGTFQIQSIF